MRNKKDFYDPELLNVSFSQEFLDRVHFHASNTRLKDLISLENAGPVESESELIILWSRNFRPQTCEKNARDHRED